MREKERGGTPLSGRGDEGLMKSLTLILFTIRALPGLLIFESIEISITFFKGYLMPIKE